MNGDQVFLETFFIFLAKLLKTIANLAEVGRHKTVRHSIFFFKKAAKKKNC